MPEPSDYDKTRWLSTDEQDDALDPTVGDGTPETAPERPAGAWNHLAEGTSWRPTRKWIGGLVTGLAGVAASWIVTGAFDDVERGMVGTLITSLAAAYWVSNDPTPGGVPGGPDDL